METFPALVVPLLRLVSSDNQNLMPAGRRRQLQCTPSRRRRGFNHNDSCAAIVNNETYPLYGVLSH